MDLLHSKQCCLFDKPRYCHSKISNTSKLPGRHIFIISNIKAHTWFTSDVRLVCRMCYCIYTASTMGWLRNICSRLVGYCFCWYVSIRIGGQSK